MGSRSSERFGRCYDRRGPTRFEVEMKGERSKVVVADLMAKAVEEWPGVIMAHIRDFVDFDRAWWRELMAGVARARVKVRSAVEMTVERAKGWYMRQVAPTVAALVEHDGGDMGFVYEALRDGARRYGRRQRQILAGGA